MSTSRGIRPEAQRRVPSRTYLEAAAEAPRPLIEPAPRSVMYLPLVLLIAILPGLYALRNWDLNPPGPWWGLRGLAVLEGRVLDQTTMPGLPPGLEEKTYRAVALQPPLYAWLEAVGLWFSRDRAPLATVLPSYAAGAIVVLISFYLGKLWRGPGVGLVAAILTGFNHSLLVQMQQATPATLGLAGALAAVLGYGKFLEANEGRRVRWIVFGGTGLGLSLLSVGTLGLAVIPTVLLHRAFMVRMAPLPRNLGVKHWWREHSELFAGAAALAIALLLAGPWHLMMVTAHGRGFVAALLEPPQVSGPSSDLFSRMLELAPATLPLGLWGAMRAVKQGLKTVKDDRQTIGATLCLSWLAIAAVTPLVLAKGPRPALNLWLLIPVNLFAAATIADLANRALSVRTLCWLGPACAVTTSWWTSSHMRHATSDLLAMRSPGSGSALGVRLTLGLLVTTFVIVRGLDFWSRKSDQRQVRILGGCLAALLLVTVAAGLREVQFRHRETSELLSLRDSILRRHSVKPITTLAVVGPVPGSDVPGSRPGGRLRFLLRATLPDLAQIDLQTVEDLRKLPGNQKLVILAGNQARLDYASQSRLGLEAIHPGRSGELEAFATRNDGNRLARRESKTLD